ncbi:MAG: oligopeptide/dipeptide ABC transporter ATP-binding protein [Hyphomicrobiales bacterium]
MSKIETRRVEPALEAIGLQKTFTVRGGLPGSAAKKVHAVSDVSFRLQPGTTLGIVGESGCGKSTLARLLLQLIEPDTGDVLLNGSQILQTRAGLKAYRSHVQMVFQDSSASLNPRLTIEQSIIFGPLVHGVSKENARSDAHQLLAQVGLEPALYAGRYPHELSGGQRQRVNIARALALKPKIVIFDEAVSALDKSVEAQVLNLLNELKAQLDLSFIFISHDLNVVRYIADTLIVMYLGEVVESGPVDRIYDNPRHPYTRALLASMPSTDPQNRTLEAPIVGDPPSPIDLPPGCRFAPRCPFAEPICSTRAPVDSPFDSAMVRCHMADPASTHTRAGHAYE